MYSAHTNPTRLLDQYVEMVPSADNILEPIIPLDLQNPLWDQSGDDVSTDNDYFEVNLDVQHFNPNEITVMVVGDNEIWIEGKRDDHGVISSQFQRKYMLPLGHDTKRVNSKLSSDGVLTVTAPKVDDDVASGQKRTIPIEYTGRPSNIKSKL